MEKGGRKYIVMLNFFCLNMFEKLIKCKKLYLLSFYFSIFLCLSPFSVHNLHILYDSITNHQFVIMILIVLKIENFVMFTFFIEI